MALKGQQPKKETYEQVTAHDPSLTPSLTLTLTAHDPSPQA
jgi:hypothetical protein